MWLWTGRLWVSTHMTALIADGKQIVPWTAPRLGPDMPASKLLLDLDKWAEDKWKKTIDITAGGIVSGVVDI